MVRKLLDLRKTLLIAFQKPFDTASDNGRTFERQRRIALTAFTSIIAKSISMATPLITLRITLNYLGVEVYGLWSAVSTFFALFAFSDLGLGNGLQTKLSQSYGKDDIELSKRIISSTYFILLLVGSFLLLLFLAVFKLINWAALMNAQSDETIAIASSIVFVIVIPRILSIPTAIIQRTQFALQEGFRTNYWQISGSLLSVVSIFLCAKLDVGKVALLGVSSIIPVCISVLNIIVYFGFQRKDLKFSFQLVDKEIMKSMLSLGVYFLILSILLTIGLSMDTFIVAKTCSLEDAGSYAILYRVSAIFSAVVGILAAPLWGANGEAIARGDITWVEKNTRRMSLIMGGVSIAIALIGIASAKFIFKIWLGPDFEFSLAALIWLSVMQIILSFISPYFMLLNASGIVKKQIVLFGVYTPISFGLKYYLSQQFGIYMIPMAGTLLYFFIVVIGIYNFSVQQLKKLNYQSAKSSA